MSNEFQALQTSEVGGKYINRVVTRSLEDLPEGELQVRVLWSSLNYKDALSASGNRGVTRQYPHTPGIDAVGEVIADSSGRFAPGVQVIVTGYDLGMNTAGGYSRYIRVPAAWALPLPAAMTPRLAMIHGTAGLTAGFCVTALLDAGITPSSGPLVVTGASGGVGSLAVALLCHLGFEVTAISGKTSAVDWLKSLGAAEVLGRDVYAEGADKPMLKGRWAGGVDTLAGQPLAAVLKATCYGGAVACCGMAASASLETSIFPFILRNVRLLGVDSVEQPPELKLAIWQRLATDWALADPDKLVAAEVDLESLPQWFDAILRSQVQGRVIVNPA